MHGFIKQVVFGDTVSLRKRTSKTSSYLFHDLISTCTSLLTCLHGIVAYFLLTWLHTLQHSAWVELLFLVGGVSNINISDRVAVFEQPLCKISKTLEVMCNKALEHKPEAKHTPLFHVYFYNEFKSKFRLMLHLLY